MLNEPGRRLAVLLLCDRYAWSPGTVHRHIQALSGDSRHAVHVLPLYGDLPAELDLERFDAVVVHYSVFVFDETHLSASARRRLAAFQGVKAVFIQDEHRFVERTVAALAELGVDLLFTCVPEGESAKVYPPERLPGLRRITVLTGYLDPDLARRPVPAYGARPIDVGYRARKLPPWLGELGREKWRIAERFLADAPRYGLVCDISTREEDRLHDEAWIRFVASCKAMLGSESGASVFDFTGEIARRAERHALERPEASFEELRDRFFAEAEGRIASAVISPRCFEAAALRTLMILYEGGYSGVLTPWRHYVPLRKDHANMDEVVAVLRDEARAGAIVEAAWREVACNPAYSFAVLTRLLDESLAAAAKRPAVGAPYDEAAFARLVERQRWRIGPRKIGIYARYAAGRVLLRQVFGLLPDPLRDRLAGGLRRLYRRLAAS